MTKMKKNVNLSYAKTKGECWHEKTVNNIKNDTKEFEKIKNCYN